MKYSTAKAYCRSKAMVLASIKNEAENQFFTENTGNDWYYLGGERDVVNPTMWRWISEDQPWMAKNGSAYTNWNYNKPSYQSTGLQDCITIYKGRWNDDPCNLRGYFVCKNGKL